MQRTDIIPTEGTEDGRPLTPAQERFRSLVKRIEAERHTLRAWETHAPAFRRAYREALDPLMHGVDAATRQWAFALDEALARATWTAAERTTLRGLLCEAAADLLDAGIDDPELKVLFDRHADIDFDTGQRMRRDEEAAAAEAQPHPVEDRRERDALGAAGSLREIYRKLASALHPDRETDPVQRKAKTVRMQQVNRAYDNRDLLSLLQLQLDSEQIDTHHVATAGDQRLRQYNTVLGEQLEDLKDEVHHLATDFCMEFQLESWPLPRPEKLTPFIERATREAKADLFRLQCNLRMLDDVAATRRWLRGQRLQRREPSGA